MTQNTTTRHHNGGDTVAWRAMAQHTQNAIRREGARHPDTTCAPFEHRFLHVPSDLPSAGTGIAGVHTSSSAPVKTDLSQSLVNPVPS
jgi:hypothetical protein